MKKRKVAVLFGTFIIAMIFLQVPFSISLERESGIYENQIINTSVLDTETVEIVIGMSDNYDVDEPIYVGVAGIRNAKAQYVKPLSLKLEMFSREFEGVSEFVIASRKGYYNELGEWVQISGAVVHRLNDFIYFTSFQPFGFDAELTMKVTMEWLAPWGQVLTSVNEKEFVVGEWFNVTGIIDGTQSEIENSVLKSVNLGIDFALPLIEDVTNILGLLKTGVEQLQQLIGSASIDPGNLNIYVVDLIGNTANAGPLFDVVRDDLYSHITTTENDRNNTMDARYTYIMDSIRDSLDILDNKLGANHDPSGDYSYTVTFVEELYEQYVLDSNYVNPVDSVNTIIQASDKQGNLTGGSWAQHRTASLEFLLESLTGDHPKFKSTLGGAYNIHAPRKSIIINTMGAYFPIMNSWYAYHEIDEETDRPDLISTGGRLEFDNSDIFKNLRRLILKYSGTVDGGTSNITGSNNDMFDPIIEEYYSFGTDAFPIVNYTRYLKKLSDGMSSGFYYWINMGGGRPFSKMTRDIDLDVDNPSTGGITEHYFSDGKHDVILNISNKDDSNTMKLNRITGSTPNTWSVTNPSFVISQYLNRTMFQILDSGVGITSDQLKYLIESKPIGSTNTEYYKINPARWIDAFFNGTDLSRIHGTLADSTYITAREETGYSWWSPKAPMYSFNFEDSYVFYQIGMLDNFRFPNEYIWTCFVGPNKQVPIGWMTSASMWYSVVGTYDYQMALEYLYGGIFMGYKEAVLGYKNMATQMLVGALEGTNVPDSTLHEIMSIIDEIDLAWDTLNLTGIDEAGEKLLTLMSEKSVDGQSVHEQMFMKAINRTSLAYAVLSKDQSNLPFIDNGLSTAGSDASLSTVGEILQDLIKNNLLPTLTEVGTKFLDLINRANQLKKRRFNTTVDLGNSVINTIGDSFIDLLNRVDGIADGIGELSDRTGRVISNVANNVNSTLHSVTDGVVSWTSEQLAVLESETTRRFGQVGQFISEEVIGTLYNVADFMEDGVFTVLNFTKNVTDRVGGIIQNVGAGIEVGLGVGGVIAGTLLGGPIGAIGLGYAGQALGGVIGNTVSGIGELITGGGELFYDTASGLVSGAFDGARFLINVTNNTAQWLINKTGEAIGVGLNRTIDVVNTIGDYTHDFITFGANFASNMGDDISGFGANVESGIEFALGSIEQMANKTITWSQTQFTNMMKMDLEVMKTLMTITTSSVTGTLQLVKIVISVMEQVSAVIGDLVGKMNEAFEDVNQLFEATTDFLVDLAGTAVTTAIDFSRNIADQLVVIEDALQSSTGFFSVIGTLYEEVRQGRVSASILEYAQQTMGTTKELYFKWTDVVQPISNIRGGDTSFRIHQMGSSFANRLYFITTYDGSPVVVDDITLNVSRLAMEDETVPGDILTATIPVYPARDDSNVVIDGVYFASFNTTNVYEWYGDTINPVKIETPRPANYLTRIDAEYTTPIASPHEGEVLNNTWMEETVLFNASFTIDAFPDMTILSTYPDVINAGQTQDLLLTIANEMYSEPFVSIELTISTNDGFLISQRKIADVQLPSEGDGAELFQLEWTPSENTPSGTFDLLITVVEQNGDTTTRAVTVEIKSATLFGDFLGTIIAIFSAIASFFGLTAFAQQRKINSLSKKIDSKGIGERCSLEDMKNGKCSIEL